MPEDRSPDLDPFTQDEAVTLEAEMRQALQHQRAALEQAEETREEMRRLMERARDLLKRNRQAAAPEGVLPRAADTDSDPAQP